MLFKDKQSHAISTEHQDEVTIFLQRHVAINTGDQEFQPEEKNMHTFSGATYKEMPGILVRLLQKDRYMYHYFNMFMVAFTV